MGLAVQDGRRSGLTCVATASRMTDAAPFGRLICRLADLPEGGGKGFWFGEASSRFGIFLLRRGQAVLAYRNSCPHRGTPLDWQPDRFLDAEGRLIQCATHGALFRIEDGFCVSGPCVGAHLAAIAIELRDGVIYWGGDTVG
jgi:naringenin degradation protein FdeD